MAPAKKQTAAATAAASPEKKQPPLKKQTSKINAAPAHDHDDDDEQSASPPPSKVLKKQASKTLVKTTSATALAEAKPKRYLDMIIEAIKHFNNGKKGSSKQAIEKWVRESYSIDEVACNKVNLNSFK